jgi:hypothetical protein
MTLCIISRIRRYRTKDTNMSIEFAFGARWKYDLTTFIRNYECVYSQQYRNFVARNPDINPYRNTFVFQIPFKLQSNSISKWMYDIWKHGIIAKRFCYNTILGSCNKCTGFNIKGERKLIQSVFLWWIYLAIKNYCYVRVIAYATVVHSYDEWRKRNIARWLNSKPRLQKSSSSNVVSSINSISRHE